jgi:hypothetical protein
VQITAVMETTNMNGTQVFRKPATLKKNKQKEIFNGDIKVIKPTHNL